MTSPTAAGGKMLCEWISLAKMLCEWISLAKILQFFFYKNNAFLVT